MCGLVGPATVNEVFQSVFDLQCFIADPFIERHFRHADLQESHEVLICREQFRLSLRFQCVGTSF